MNDQTDRVRRHTAAEVLRRIDNATVTSLSGCDGSPAKTDRRLKELDEEWDTDRALETEAATMGLIGLALGAFVRKQLVALPAIVAAAVLLQATTGRYPLMPVFRRLGVRTSKEIARERYALKALRGDVLVWEQLALPRPRYLANSLRISTHPTTSPALACTRSTS